jgi:hypothetical protein
MRLEWRRPECDFLRALPATMSPPTPTPPPKKSGLFPDATWLCCFLIAFPGFLFLTRPANTPGPLLFRLALMLAGGAGLLGIWWRKRKT